MTTERATWTDSRSSRAASNVLAGDEVAAGGFGVAEGGVALMEVVVEVAPESVGEGWGLAAGSVGLDVATECVLHDLLPGGPPIACV